MSDIAPHLISLGLPPNDPGAFAPYTLPAIYDPRTGTTVMDSIKIIAYLDETYPDTPPLFPLATRSLIHAFQAILHTTAQEHFSLLLVPHMITKLNGPSQDHLNTKLETIFGCKAADILTLEQRAERWSTLEQGLTVLASWFELAGDGRLLLMGGDGADGTGVCHADTSIAGMLKYARVGFGEDSEEWQRVERLNGGRWKRFLNFFDKVADASHI